MNQRILGVAAAGAITAGFAVCANAAEATYNLDPAHTYPSFEADHFGVSVFRGKFTKTSGVVKLDREARTGSIDVSIDPSAIDTGNPALDTKLKSDAFFDVAKYPTASYRSTRMVFTGEQPSEVIGDLTLHGVTRPVTLKIVSFKCRIHPTLKREICGADVTGSFDRADFGMNYGANMGYKTLTKLQIQVEGIKSE